jgi:glutathione S-transferase
MGPQAQQPPSQLTPAQREQAWQAVKEQFDTLADLLDKNSGTDGDGVVAMGREVSYADFALCAVLIWIEKVAPQDGWTRIRQWNGGRWVRLWERCHDYMDVF